MHSCQARATLRWLHPRYTLRVRLLRFILPRCKLQIICSLHLPRPHLVFLASTLGRLHIWSRKRKTHTRERGPPDWTFIDVFLPERPIFACSRTWKWVLRVRFRTVTPRDNMFHSLDIHGDGHLRMHERHEGFNRAYGLHSFWEEASI
jgi:hypothetical protein